jgi:hypothetical protein
MIFIKRELIPDPKAYEQGYGHAYGQTGDIYKGQGFVLLQVAQGGLEIASEHAVCFGILPNCSQKNAGLFTIYESMG